VGRVLVVGIGNEMRGDDGAGPALVEKLDASREVMLLDAGTVPESFIGKMREAGADLILLVDAVDFGGRPGSIAFFQAEEIPEGWCTTHQVPLGVLMRFLGQEAGSDVLLLGIQPRTICQNAPMSPEVEASVGTLAEIINSRLVAGVEALRTGG